MIVLGTQMLGDLANIPTDTLIDMLGIIFADDRVLTLTDVTDVEQIQRELQRRAKKECWNSLLN